MQDGDGGGIVLDNLDPAAITIRGLLLGSNDGFRGTGLLTRLGRAGTLTLPHFTINSNSGGNAILALGESHLAFVNTIVNANVGGWGASTTNTARMFIALKERPERTTPISEVINRLRPKLAKVEGVQTFLNPTQDVRIGRIARTAFVYTLEDGRIVRKPVTLGPKIKGQEFVEVREGLKEGERVIVADIGDTKPGSEAFVRGEAPNVESANKG